MIRILNIVGSVDIGGIESFLINLYRRLDKSRYQFDFIVYQTPQETGYSKEIRRYGGKIYQIPSKTDGIVANLSAIYKIVKKNDYKIVWRHTETLFKGLDLWAAKMAGAELTILHSHSSNADNREYFLGKILSLIINPAISLRWACGKKAGKALFGNRDFNVIRNGIIVDQWEFNQKVREEYRKRLGIENETIYGHVGRFSSVKNHMFLLEIFKKILQVNVNSRLLLVGDGELKNAVMNKAVQMGLQDNVLFLGNRSDVSNLMDAMDVFIFPSIYEGVPVSVIEAQAKDLPCLISDAIDRECCVVKENVEYMNIGDWAEHWAKTASTMKKEHRISRKIEIQKAGYDIDETLIRICEIWDLKHE